MMKKIQILVMICLAVFTLSSCSSDDNDTVQPDEGILEGEWQLTKMDYLEDSAVWDDDVEYNSSTAFGYSPFMFRYGGVKGFVFGQKEVIDEAGNFLGRQFDYVLDLKTGQDEDEAYWYWNYTDNGNAFEAIQINPNWPPHDYSITDVADVKVEGNQVKFEANLYSRIPGGERGDVVKTRVAFTMIKAEAINNVEVYIQGEPFNREPGEGEQE